MSVKARIQSGKTQVQEVEGHAAKDQKTSPNFQLVNKPSRFSPHEVLQSRLINSVHHLLVKNLLGEGREGGLNRGFMVSKFVD